jgi:hypothetical protein
MNQEILHLNYQLTVLKEQVKEIQLEILKLQAQLDVHLKEQYNLNPNVNYEGLK